MLKRTLRIAGYGFILGLILLSGLTLVPRSYDVLAFEERPNTLYWALSTGSKIGYQKLEGDSMTGHSPIIYLHGGPGGRIADETIEMLAPLRKFNHDIYLYDQLGSGHSGRLDDISAYTVERHKEDLEEIVSKIGSGQVVLIGQSWGALLAIEYLKDNPDKVERLILTGPGPMLPINRALSMKAIPDSLSLRAPRYSNSEGNRKASNMRSKFLYFVATKFGVKASTDQEADDFFTYLNSELSKSTKCDPVNMRKSAGGGGYYSHIMTVNSFAEVEDNKAKIKGLKVPCLIVKGECDNQKWGFAEEYIETFPNTTLEIIVGAGHSIGMEHKEVYLSIISKFLDQ